MKFMQHWGRVYCSLFIEAVVSEKFCDVVIVALDSGGYDVGPAASWNLRQQERSILIDWCDPKSITVFAEHRINSGMASA